MFGDNLITVVVESIESNGFSQAATAQSNENISNVSTQIGQSFTGNTGDVTTTLPSGALTVPPGVLNDPNWGTGTQYFPPGALGHTDGNGIINSGPNQFPAPFLRVPNPQYNPNDPQSQQYMYILLTSPDGSKPIDTLPDGSILPSCAHLAIEQYFTNANKYLANLLETGGSDGPNASTATNQISLNSQYNTADNALLTQQGAIKDMETAPLTSLGQTLMSVMSAITNQLQELKDAASVVDTMKGIIANLQGIPA